MGRSTRHRGLLSFVCLAVLIGFMTPAAAGEPASFAVVLLPDTQNYSERLPQTYLAQTEWIRERAAAENVKFVIHLGDIVQRTEAEEEWMNADRAHRVLDGVVPYSVLPGNHDGAPGNTALFNKYFPPARFDPYPWYGGHFGRGNENNYCCFNAAGMKFMVLSLECRPGDEALAWANGVVERYHDRRVIVATHDYMDPKQRREAGENIWNKLVRRHQNIFMVVCGHIGATAHQVSFNDAGGQVHEILCDYQNRPHGGNGWLQLLRFVPCQNVIHVEAYSPLSGQYANQPQPVCTLAYDMRHRKWASAGWRRFARLTRVPRRGFRPSRRSMGRGWKACPLPLAVGDRPTDH